jgi:hypothetical protein
MKTDTGIKHYSSRSDYIQNRGAKKAADLVSKVGGDTLKSVEDKIQLSDESKAKSISDTDPNSKSSKSKKSIKDKVKNNLNQNKNELKKASSHLLSDAVGVAKNALNMPGIGSVVDIASGLIPESSTVEKATEVLLDKKEEGQSEGPKLIFVSGLHLAGLSADGEGLEEMAREVENGKHYSWKEEDKILDEIKRTPKEEPIVLVGHSLGGDAVVNISNKLNSLAFGFRKVDLLVTLDSVGFDNDIIPKNVKRNLNYIGDKDVFFNDGPNIARNFQKTEVLNELRKESHTELDDSLEIQEQVYGEIDSILTAHKEKSAESDMIKKFLSTMMTKNINEDTLK